MALSSFIVLEGIYEAMSILQTPLSISINDIPPNLELNKTYEIKGQTYRLNKLKQRNVIGDVIDNSDQNVIKKEGIKSSEEIYVLELII